MGLQVHHEGVEKAKYFVPCNYFEHTYSVTYLLLHFSVVTIYTIMHQNSVESRTWKELSLLTPVLPRMLQWRLHHFKKCQNLWKFYYRWNNILQRHIWQKWGNFQHCGQFQTKLVVPSSSTSPGYCNFFAQICYYVSYVASIGFLSCVYGHMVVCLYNVFIWYPTMCAHIWTIWSSWII